HRLFNRARDRDERLRRRHDAVVNDDDDAREIRFREDGDGQLPRGVETGSAEQCDDDDDRALLVGDGAGKAHGSSFWSAAFFSLSPFSSDSGFSPSLTSTFIPSGSA